ncbi:MAG: HAMP domain-containing sensor histidine kinase [Porticoccus sp.]|nr:HAMP domain-containing sensor histidine kinase [Porticoccus sp.]
MNKKNKNKLDLNKTYLIYITALLFIVFLQWQYENTIEEHSEEFYETSNAEMAILARDISNKIHTLYQGLRTIARLPGTRTIGRTGSNFDADAKHTFQEIYNNLYTNISLSELYIIPKGFDPDKLDPITGVNNEPILTFDEFIVGKYADKKTDDKNIVLVGEEEIHEYRLMRDQLNWFGVNYPFESSVTDLNYPAISGPEVITCDNTFYSPANPDEKDRSGLVYSVPYYGVDGSLRGIVSGVVLTKVLQKLIPNKSYALVNTKQDYIVSSVIESFWPKSLALIKKGLPDESLFFSKVIDLPIVDNSQEWKLWVGRTQNEFYQLDEIVAYERNKYVSFVVVVLFAVILHFILIQQRNRRSLIVGQNEYLEKMVEDRTHTLILANERLVKANDAKANFLSRVSHELRTPLNAIIGYSDLLIDGDFSDEKLVLEDVNKIKLSGVHLLNLINEVLDISKIESGKMEVYVEIFKVREMLDEVCAAVKPVVWQGENTLTMTIDDNVDVIMTDRLKIQQILLNLLSNAAKFTQRGEITVNVKTVFEHENENIVFQVSDTGVGIEGNKLDRIFEEFYQTHEVSSGGGAGSGLGLAICLRLANILQGTIQVISKHGDGSTFTLTVPREPSN